MPPSSPPPKSVLGRHRLLAPSELVRVSPLSTGFMPQGAACVPSFRVGSFDYIEPHTASKSQK